MKSSLTNESVASQLTEKFGEAIKSIESPYGFLTVEVSPSFSYEIIEWLKNESSLSINFLTNIGAVHYPENLEREFAVVYHLHSMVNNFRIRLKSFVSAPNPEIKSIVDLYVGANWMERETYDFYGINFLGHPNLKRILNEDTMDYFPLRKEFHLEDETREDKDDRFFGR